VEERSGKGREGMDGMAEKGARRDTTPHF